ncbi:MAG: glycoside hydrolase family 99-like domain-containing protein [Candidatus Bathyarchaeia archaeon]
MSIIQEIRNKIDINKVPKLVIAFYHCWYGTPSGPRRKWEHWNHPIFDYTTPEQRQIYTSMDELRFKLNKEEISEEEFKEKIKILQEKSKRVVPTHDPEKIIGPEGRRDIGAAHYPLIGPYDSTDPELIKYHIELAEAAGIDVFAFNWWGQGDITDISLENFCDVVEKINAKVKATALIDGYCWFGGYPLKKSIEMFSYFLERYRDRKSFLQLEKMPVVMFYQAGVYSPKQWGEIRLNLRRRGLDGVFLGGECFKDDYSPVFEGFEYYSPLSISPFSESNLRKEYARSVAICKNSDLIAGLAVMPGYDDRQVRFPGTVVARRESSCYNMTWRVAMEQDPRWIMICSWNEWHEGSEIEPSVEYGDYYIKLTKQWAEEFKKK